MEERKFGSDYLGSDYILRVHRTTDYGMFKGVKGNRKIRKLSVKRLVASMEKSGFLQSQHLASFERDGSLFLIDGQHRLEAAKLLGIAVYYVIDNALADAMCIKLNTLQQNWNNQDYMKYFCDNGCADYIELRDFVSKYGFSVSDSCAMLMGMNQHNREVQVKYVSGEFKVMKRESANILARNILDFKKYGISVKGKYFVRAMLELAKNPKYNHEKMISKMETRHMYLLQWNSAQGYVENLLKIYNHRVTANKLKRVV